MMTPRPLATREQVADYLGVSVPTLDRWRKIGKGPKSRKLGRSVRYDWDDVEAWVRRKANDDPDPDRFMTSAEADSLRRELNDDPMTPGMPDPCQPIGCDNGFHLPGCTFAARDAA